MRTSLLNNQPELESYETQKTSQLKAMTRILMAIFIMLLTPQVSWAQTEYDLWVGDTRITDANCGDIKTYITTQKTKTDSIIDTQNTPGSISFEPISSTLTLTNIQLNIGIKSNLSKLKIHFIGTNKIYTDSNADRGPSIWSSNSNAEIEFESDGGAAATSTLELKSTLTHSVIRGFDTVTYGANAYLSSDHAVEYASHNINEPKMAWDITPGYNTKLSTMTVTTNITYPLWVSGGQITANDNKGMNFSPDSHLLALNNDTYDYPIISGLDDLTILFSGNNKLGDSRGYIKSVNENATLTLEGDAGGGKLEILSSTSSTAISGFKSVTLVGAYIHSDTPYKFNATSKQYERYYDGAPIQSFDVTTTPYYMLWIGSIGGSGQYQATGGAFTSIPEVSFNGTSSTLTLNNANFWGFIYSALGDLTIDLIGDNFIRESDAYTNTNKNPVTSDAGGTVTFKTSDGTGTLSFPDMINYAHKNPISGFTVKYEDNLYYSTTDSIIKKKNSPSISFRKKDQSTGSDLNDYVGATETIEATYGTTFYAPRPVFNNGFELSDTTRYVYTYAPDGIVEFPITSTDANTGKINYGQLNLLKAGNVVITCSFPGNEGNLPCSASYSLTVNPKSMSTTYVSCDASADYTGSAITPTVTVKESATATTTLTAGTDYTISYQKVNSDKTTTDVTSMVDAGDYFIVITGLGNHNGSKSVSFTINKLAITPAVNITGWAYGTYDATTNAPSVTAASNPGNGTVTYKYKQKGADDATYKDEIPTLPGNYTVQATVAETTNYMSGTGTADFAITTRDISTATFSVVSDQTYTGSAITPEPTVTVGGTLLTKGTDYTLGHSNNTNVGTATITATGTGNYSGTASTTFQIVKAAGDISYATATIDKTFGDGTFTNPLTKTGDGTVSYETSNAAVAKVDAATGEVTIMGAGSATITATVTDGANYTYATKTASYTVTVSAAAMGSVTATGYTGTYDGAAHGITVNAPAGATVKYGTAAGSYTLDASPTYTNAGTYTVYYQVTRANYNAVTGSQTVTISKAAGTISFATTSISKIFGDGAFTNALTNTGDGAVTYSSSNTAIATVNRTSGEVTLKGIGSATITVTVADGTNYTYATKTASYTLNVASKAKKFNLWINKTQVTEDNMNNILGDAGNSFQYFPDLNKLFITNNTTPVSIETRSGLTIYLAPNSNNKVKEIVRNSVTSESASLVITTDGNFPGRLELATSGDNVIEGFDELILEENLSILEADDEVQYTNGKLATMSATIGIVIDPIVEERVESFEGADFGKNPDGTESNLENYVYDDRVLLTLKNTKQDGGDGIDDSGTQGIVLNNQTYEDDIDRMNLEEYAPGTTAFADIFTGITVLVPGGEGWIVIDGETHDGYCIKLRSLFGDELKEQMTSEIRSKKAFYYTFSEPTFVGIYNGGKTNNAAREKVIRPGKKTVGHIKVFNVNVSPKKVQAANPAGAASGGDYTGVVPTIGQDENNPTEIESGIKDIERSTLNVQHSADKWYNMNGQQIDEPTKAGIYIHNGKKVFVKE